MGVNHVGHMLLTQLLLPALTTHGSPARVVAVSSMAHAYDRGFEAGLDDLGWRARPERGYDPWVAYGNSKLANVLFARELANRWGVTAKPQKGNRKQSACEDRG